MRARSLDRLVSRCLTAAVGCLLAVAGAEPAAALEAQRAPAPVPHLAAVVPGLLAHGTGPWLQGRSVTSRRLFWMQGTSVLLLLGGASSIIFTGASKYVVGPGALVAANGVTLFGTSMLSGLYSTFAPQEGWGQATARLPLLETRMGYQHVADSQFAYRDFLVMSVDAYPQSWHLGLAGDFAPGQGNQRWQALVGRRVWGVSGAKTETDGSYLELRLGHGEHRFETEQFVSQTTEMLAEGRLDLKRYLPDVRGAFVQSTAGYARQRFAFDRADSISAVNTSLLLMRMGFGVYFGNRSFNSMGGEVEGYYDHRHDGFVGGLKVRGLGSGALGHFGVRAKFRASPTWGLAFRTEAGAAWLWNLSLVMRSGNQ